MTSSPPDAPAQPTRSARYVRPRSNPHALAKIDLRSREARLVARTRADLIAHIGGNPSPVERRLVERAAMLSLYVAMFDSKALEAGGILSDEDSKKYLAYSNSLARTLRELGLKGAAQRGPTLAEHLAKRAAEKAAEVAA